MDAKSVREVLDRLDIMSLTARYNRAALSWDAERFAECFTPGGCLVRVHVGSTVTGTDSLKAMMQSGAESGMSASYHLTSDFIIEIDGDEATQTCQVLLYGVNPSAGLPGPNVLRGVGHFEDKLIRTSDGWRFEERVAWLTGPNERPRPIGAAVASPEEIAT